MTRFAGYAAVFDAVDRGGDVVRKGAFRARGTVPLLWQHSGKPVGEIEWLGEDSRGLRVIGRVEDAKLAGLVEAGAVRGLSFGYRVRAARRGSIGSNLPRTFEGCPGDSPTRCYREITRLDLMEVSLVASPMQPLARVHAVESG